MTRAQPRLLPRRNALAIVALVTVMAGLMASCGTSADDTSTDTSSIGQPGLDGAWMLVTATDSDGSIGLDQLALEIDTEFAVVKTDDICQRAFGSLSFTAAGDSTFTIPGSTTAPCDDDLEVEHLRFVAALEAVTTWDSASPGLVLAGPEQVRLEFRPAG